MSYIEFLINFPFFKYSYIKNKTSCIFSCTREPLFIGTHLESIYCTLVVHFSSHTFSRCPLPSVNASSMSAAPACPHHPPPPYPPTLRSKPGANLWSSI